jgi:leucyl-tRNA synthetase
MALHDLDLVDVAEPFKCLRLHGIVTRDGAKMSKSRGNVVSPDDYVDRHGGDLLRVHLLSSGRWWRRSRRTWPRSCGLRSVAPTRFTPNPGRRSPA